MKILILMGITAVIGMIAFVILAYVMKRRDQAKTEHDVLSYLQQHPDQVSLCLIKDGEEMIGYHADRRMPLASVCKIIVAVEFSRQAASGQIDPHEEVPVQKLLQYYIPDSDGGAHDAWLNSLRGSADAPPDKVTLLEVAQGMIQFSSNANTDYLLSVLGVHQINQTLIRLGLQSHDKLFPLSIAFTIPAYLNQSDPASAALLTERLREMSASAIGEIACELHLQIQKDGDQRVIPPSHHKITRQQHVQRAVSEKLPRSTAREYAQLMKRIYGDETLLPPKARQLFRSIMERKLREGSPFNYMCHKGGSTISIINEVVYAEDRQGRTVEVALFMHNFNPTDRTWLNAKLDLFIRGLLVDEQFVHQARRALQPQAG